MAPKRKAPADEAKEPASKKPRSGGDALQLHGLFEGAEGPSWEKPLREALEVLDDAEKFIGPGRDKTIVPVRELTFQALKPNRPAGWRVIIFGQNPYPRLESATGIAMFDNAFDSWQSKRFGAVTSMRCIVKAAAQAKYGIPFATSVDELRKLLQEKDTVSPPEWFQAMLSQGVLLLNAALTVGGSGLKPADHNKFWRPVVERIVDEILTAKHGAKAGVAFVWWGAESLKTKKALAGVLERHAGKVSIEHVEHANPAAQGDAFCKPQKGSPHFAHVNAVLKGLRLPEVDWLPDSAWLKNASGKKGSSSAAAGAAAMGSFIAETKELHRLYIERLQSGLEKTKDLDPIEGIMASKAMSLQAACKALKLEGPGDASLAAVKTKERGKLTVDEAGSIHMYTGDSLYRKLNEVLRNPDRKAVKDYFAYLRLFLTALKRLAAGKVPLFRGIKKNLAKEYPEGSTITWWAVSSCTPNLGVAKSFGGGSAGGTLFKVSAETAVPIMELSAYAGEEEYVLAPGTRLQVVKVQTPPGGAVEITLKELPGQALVS